jgi:hypothetical protein
MGHAATGDAKEPESVLGLRRYIFEASPGNYEDLGDNVVDLFPRDSTGYVGGDVAEMERVHPLEFRLPLIAHPGPRLYSAQYLLITTTYAREYRKPVTTDIAFPTFLGVVGSFLSVERLVRRWIAC